MNPFERLGIAAGSDEREIKRAYARQLKHTRPDEDPAGFQALHEAYQHCLSIAQNAAQRRAERSPPPREEPSPQESAEPSHPPGAAPAAPTGPHRTPPRDAGHDAGREADREAGRPPDREPDREPIHARPAPLRPRRGHAPPPGSDDPAAAARGRFDLGGFLHELFARAASERPVDLQRWLHDLEPLYALELKHALRIPVARALAEADPPPPIDAIDAIAEFFALVSTDPRERRLRQALDYAYQRSERIAHFQRIVARHRSRNAQSVEVALMNELLGPRSWPRRLFIAMIPTLPSRLMALLARLEQADATLAESQLDADSLRFWRRASDRKRLDYRRVLIALARCAYYYALTVSLASLLMGLAAEPFAHTVRNVAALFAAWLVPTALWAALLQLKDRIEPRWGWDTPIVLATPVLLACLVAGYFAPVEAGFFACVATVLLVLARGRIHSVPAVAFYVASLTGLCAIASILGNSMDRLLPYLAVAAGALQIGHDVAYARRHRISVAQTRARSGWLWPLAGLSAVAAVVLLFAGVSL